MVKHYKPGYFCKFRTIFADLIYTVEKIALIVAGGLGSRMNANIPKQFIILKGFPILMHTISAFYRYDQLMRIVVVLPENQINEWEKLCLDKNFRIRHEIKVGGETRFYSVKKNIAALPDQCLIAVHDGVRPLVSVATIERCFEGALKYNNAVPCIEIPETMRELGKESSRQVDRNCYRLIQTPQVFKAAILKKAYLQEYQNHFTDDAGVVENMGYSIHLVAGNPENIKITLPSDLIVASSFIE